jgi:hypothetical protein
MVTHILVHVNKAGILQQVQVEDAAPSNWRSVSALLGIKVELRYRPIDPETSGRMQYL